MVSLVTNRFKRLPVGLDVGEHGFRAVHVKQHGRRFVVTKALQHERRSQRTRSDTEEASVSFPERMASFVRAAEIQRRCVAVELSPPDVEFHPLELPPAVLSTDETRVSELVRWEVSRLLGETDDEFETRYWPLPPTKVPAPSVMGAAVKRDAVLEKVTVCDAAGVHCLSVEPSSVALARLGGLLHEWDAKDVWGILDLGARETRLILCVDGVPTIVRRAGSGGAGWTVRISESLQVGVRAAEIQKREKGIALSSRGVRSESGGPPTRAVASIILGALRNELKDVAAEVKRSYEYALTCYPDYRVADLVLVGGGAALRNLPEFLGEALGIPVARASDFLDRQTCRLAVRTGQSDSVDELAVAIGLTLPS